MILGIAQVVVNVADLDAAEAALLEDGYTRSFRDDAISNHAAKAPFQGARRSTLAMSHLAPPVAAPAIELTSYGEPAGAAGFALQRGPDCAPARCLIEATDVEGSRAFWTDGLGFKATVGAELELRGMMPSLAFKVALHEAAGSRPATTVDADGCVLVTAVSSNVDRDLEKLAALTDGRVTEAWDEVVAGRDLRVAMIEGPSGELVELLRPPKS